TPEPGEGFDEYPSDPHKPVPFVESVAIGMPQEYMVADQRFASRRPDVLVYQTEPLEEDLTIAGPVDVTLRVSTSGTDSDFVVKLIDVYPPTFPDPEPTEKQKKESAGCPPKPPKEHEYSRMGGYQQLVRGEPFRGRFRNSFERPEPFVPDERSAIAFTMPDAFHTFRRGHRVMVQVQSSWFPLVNINPQQYMKIADAVPADFRKATQRVYRGGSAGSSLRVLVP
ncbi:MAG TPA: CocE/NonD family hydrolase, partial [Candidatus Polarisedimenticolia bacterium]|nr:CocE/NonD family hydrolase [Candidatus Polarisedimenticolia bacterium]